MVKIDQEKCIGCGMCAGMCPDIFAIGENNKAEAISQEADDCAKNAAANCPVEAITAE